MVVAGEAEPAGSTGLSAIPFDVLQPPRTGTTAMQDGRVGQWVSTPPLIMLLMAVNGCDRG